MKSCSVDGCPRPLRARGLCVTHYNQRHQPNRHRRSKVCEHCGDSYVTKRTSGRYCSLKCRDEVRAVRARDRKLPVHVGPAWPRCEVPRNHPSRRPAHSRNSWWIVIVAGSCGWCGESFVAPATTLATAPRYCSKRCLKAVDKARHRFLVPPAVRLAVYERDNWTCRLCGDPVDAALGPADPWGATLDHIECQSWTLFPDHSPQNLRLAHRWCNSVRGDERFYTADVLAA